MPLTPDEFAGMTHEEVAAISQEQSDATLNKMVQLWQDGEMDTLDEYYAAFGFATTYEEYQEKIKETKLQHPRNLPFNHCGHRIMTQMAMEIQKNSVMS